MVRSFALALMALVIGVPSAQAAFSSTPDAGIPAVNGPVYAIAVSPTRVYIGGNFTSVGGVGRVDIAAIDRTTGLLDMTYNPGANGTVRALAVSGTTVYAGGDFTNIGGQPRNYIAQLDAAGVPSTSFNPNANNSVRALLVSGTSVYAGGLFTTIGGLTRNYVAQLDGTLGTATTFNAGVAVIANSVVDALALSGTNLYFGGGFTGVGSSTAVRNLVQVNATTGTLNTGFNPDPGAIVIALAISGSNLYVGGGFDTIAGTSGRRFLAELDASSGANIAAFNPAPDNYVHSLAVVNSTVVAQGRFSAAGGTTRNGIAQFDATTGALTPFNPVAARVFDDSALAYDGAGHLYVGTASGNIGGVATDFARFTDPSLLTAVHWRGGRARMRAGHRGVRVSWRVGTDTDTVSYTITRIRGGHRTRLATVNGGAATSREPGSAYRFTDRRGRRGDRYSIKAMGLDGQKLAHRIGAAG